MISYSQGDYRPEIMDIFLNESYLNHQWPWLCQQHLDFWPIILDEQCMDFLHCYAYVNNAQIFLHARPWIPGDEIAIFTAVIH